jgi:hypothetical protein
MSEISNLKNRLVSRLSHFPLIWNIKPEKLCSPNRSLKRIWPSSCVLIQGYLPAVFGLRMLHCVKWIFMYLSRYQFGTVAWGGVVVKALRYESEGPPIDPRSCHWGFFPRHLRSPCARGRLSPLEMSNRIFLGVKTAGAYGWQPYHLSVPIV